MVAAKDPPFKTATHYEWRRESPRNQADLADRDCTLYAGPRQVSSSPPISEISLHHCLFKTSDIASSRLFTGLKTLTPAKSPVLLGRASSTDSSAKDQRDTGWFECQVVSRQHAQIEWAADESKVFIVDLGSTHGTYLSHKAARLDQGAWVEGELDAPTIRLVPHVKYELQHGDCIALGKPVEKAGQTFRAIEAYVSCLH